MTALRSVETLATTDPTTYLHITEYTNLQISNFIIFLEFLEVYSNCQVVLLHVIGRP